MSRFINTFQKLRRCRPADAERRLHKRALTYWRGLQRGKDIPLIEDFDFLEAEQGFLLEVNDTGEALLSHVGEVLREEAEFPTGATELDEVRSTSLLSQFGRRWERVVLERQPIVSEYDFETTAGYHVYCRGVLLPLSTNGSIVDRIYGVVSWKSEKTQQVPSDALSSSHTN